MSEASSALLLLKIAYAVRIYKPVFVFFVKIIRQLFGFWHIFMVGCVLCLCFLEMDEGRLSRRESSAGKPGAQIGAFAR